MPPTPTRRGFPTSAGMTVALAVGWLVAALLVLIPQRNEQPPSAPPRELAAPTTTATTSTTTTTVLLPSDPFAGLTLPVTDTELEAVKRYETERAREKGAPLPERGGTQ